MEIRNKKAGQYRILETLEAGIELLGPEVKSIRAGRVSLDGAHVIVGVGNSGTLEAHLIGMHAAPYLPTGVATIDPLRTRRLLLHRSEILALREKAHAMRMTIIPLRLYERRRMIKVSVGLARGKRNWEKREGVKKRDLRREIEREFITP